MEDTKQQLTALLPRLRRFACVLTGSVDEADDLVQAACERGLRSLEQWQVGTRLDSWMFKIMQNLWIDQTRARKARGAVVELDAARNLSGDDGRRRTEASLTLERVRASMAGLPEEQRIVLALISVEGLSYKEAAESLGVPIGTVTSRLARARRRLHAAAFGTPKAGPEASGVEHGSAY